MDNRAAVSIVVRAEPVCAGTIPRPIPVVCGEKGTVAHDDFRRGTELVAKGELAEAERAFARAMDDDVATRPQATEALIGLVSARKDFRVCSTLASTLGPTLPVGTYALPTIDNE